MADTRINIGAYSPFHATEIIPRLGSSQSEPDTPNADLKPGEPEDTTTNEQGRPVDQLELSSEAIEVRELQMRDREVRAHEAAHAAAGGSYAGSPSYTYERGPDGRTYAVGGSVGIDMAPVQGDPRATLQKAQQIRAAALAPAQPSAQDMQVAQKAQAMAIQARSDMAQELMVERENQQLNPEESSQPGALVAQQVSPYSRSISAPGPARLEIYS